VGLAVIIQEFKKAHINLKNGMGFESVLNTYGLVTRPVDKKSLDYKMVIKGIVIITIICQEKKTNITWLSLPDYHMK
jgi:hypothetical protein